MVGDVDLTQDIEQILLQIENDEDTIPYDEVYMDDEDTYYSSLLEEYHRIEPTFEGITSLLPDSKDYHYTTLLLKFYAESLKEMKDMIEFVLEEGCAHVSDDVQQFLENEKNKIKIIESLLATNKDKNKKEENANKLVLAPSSNGKIRFLDDLDHIPLEYYDEVGELIYSIVNGTFKKFRKLNRSTNNLIGGVCEVRGSKARVLFQRLNNDTYALITVFLKKADNEKVYQEYLKSCLSKYHLISNSLKEKINDSEFMELNDFYVQELWNKLDYDTNKKEYQKEMI